MIGQIRSYISYITVDSEDSYINRIRHMIDNLDDTNKEILTNELNQKINEINIIRQYTKKEINTPEINLNKQNYYNEPEDVYEKVKSFEDEINDMINDYLHNQEDNNGGNSKKGRLPSIYTSAFNLIRIYSSKPILLRKMASSNKRNKVMIKTNGVNMPTLPIYDE